MDTAPVPDSTAAPALSPELLARAADLDAARAVAVPDPIDGAGAGLDVESVTVLATQKAEADLCAFLTIAAAAFAPAFPSLPAIWTAEKCREVAKAAAPVMVKRGWVLYFGAYEAEIRLALVLFPLLGPTAQALKITKQPAAPAPASTAAPNEKNPHPGAGVTFLKPASTAPTT
jgi:hypothetical protein